MSNSLNNMKAAEQYTIGSALENALEMLRSLGYRGGDVHDDLAMAAYKLRTHFRSLYDTDLGGTVEKCDHSSLHPADMCDSCGYVMPFGVME